MLAAGRAIRFGGDKLLAPWRGQPLVAHTLDAVRRAVQDGSLAGGCVVVPARNDELLRITRDADFAAVENSAPAAGLASSLRLGVEWLERTVSHGGPAAAVIFLGDQPLVRADVVGQIVAAWEGGAHAAVRPRYAGAPAEPGHPMLIDRSLWSLAAALTGDAGLGPLLAERGVPVTVVDVEGRNPDVDTPGDLINL